MIETFTCHCGKTVQYNNPNIGSLNVGDWERATNWSDVYNTFTYGAHHVCPECLRKLIEHAEAIVALLGDANINVSSIVSAKERQAKRCTQSTGPSSSS
jgi:hypothetical protein